MRYRRNEYFACAKGAAALSERIFWKSQSVFVFVTNKRSRCLVMSIRRRHCDVPGHWSRNFFVHQSSDAEFLYKSRISLMMGKLGSISWSECNMIIERLASVVHSWHILHDTSCRADRIDLVFRCFSFVVCGYLFFSLRMTAYVSYCAQ